MLYCLEGKLEARTRPELLVGNWGYYHRDRRTARYNTGDEDQIKQKASELAEKGLVSQDILVEEITSPEQAEKYLRSNRIALRNKRTLRKPDLVDWLDTKVPPELQLLEGAVRLWSERFKWQPHKGIGFVIVGSLLEEVTYDSDKGWQSSPAAGSREIFVESPKISTHSEIERNGHITDNEEIRPLLNLQIRGTE